MASAESATDPGGRLAEILRPALADHPTLDAGQAEQLGCLLAARARFEAAVGAPPAGALAPLPSPFAGFAVPRDAEALLDAIRTRSDGGPEDAGTLAEGYERTLAAADRDARGQYYTPGPVAAALVAWALDAASPADRASRVLDPAVGTGPFLLAALRRLREDHPDRQPSALLDRLIGVDVDGVALQLAGLRLGAAAGTPVPDGLTLHHGSFFDCSPVDAPTDRDGTLPLVDAVVGNPPYVRAAALEQDTDHYRRHLASFGPDGASPWLDGADALSRRSDAYVYFVTQATRFLRTGGRLALLLPTKWLMSAYGEDLRRFLRERYRVHAVVGFGGRAFGDALVDTALLLAERQPDASVGSPMRFVRARVPTEADRLVDAVRAGPGESPVAERPQRSLTAAGSLARYLEAPAELLELLDGPRFVRLDALAEVARGTMTGANRFFFVDATTVDRFGIEPRFRRPAVKSLRSLDGPSMDPAAVERWLVEVHPLVEAVTAGLDDDADAESAVKRALSDRGYDGLRRYVDHAERAGWHEGRTCQSRSVWFDLGPLRAPGAFVPKLLRERVFAVRNVAGAVPSNAIDGVWPAEDVHTGALLAVLNASVGKAAMEVTGRDEAGLLQLMTYESASLPTLDVRTLAPEAATTVAAAGDAYAVDPTRETLAALDRAVGDAFDLSVEPARLREQAATLRRRRVDGGEVATPAD